MNSGKKYNVAVVGATGNVGRHMLSILSEREFPINNIHAIASRRSIGKEISFGEDDILKVEALDNFDFKKVDIVIASAGSSVAKEFVPKALREGIYIIDNSSYFRMHDEVPLIVPEVNLQALKKSSSNIIANPNCSVILLTVALKPLDNLFKINRLVVSTYQSTSGKGKPAMDELYTQTKNAFMTSNFEPKVFEKQIAFNIIPKIDEFNKNFYTLEEEKIINETPKIMGEHVKLSVTCVRVPVFIGHCLSVNVEFAKPTDIEEIYEILTEADGLNVVRPGSSQDFVTPVEIVGKDQVFVSRIRKDLSKENCFNMWITSDNLRKGAALNAVQIAEHLVGISVWT